MSDKQDLGKAIVPINPSISKAVALPGEFKVPTIPKKKKVLEEEDYEESITKIIERDFYPDLPQLRAQSEYLDAKARNDTEKLRELHIKYGPKRRKQTPGGSVTERPTTDIYTTPASFETPQNDEKLSTPGPETASQTEKPKQKKDTSTEQESKPSLSGGLDKFFSKHTSEDNESFVELMEEAEQKRRSKQAWLYVKEGEQEEIQNQMLALPSAEEQAAIEGNPTKLLTWTYKPDNNLMYNVAGAPLNAEEKIALAAKVREINTSGTRFTQNPFKDSSDGDDQSSGARGGYLGAVPGRVDVDGKEIGPATPKVGGYGFVATPTPNPDSVPESPMMTWGEIEGTPFLLDASDRPVAPPTPGPTFKLAAEPLRDRIGRQLAEKVAKQHRDKKQQAVDRMKSRLNTPGLSRTDRLASLSPAARRLATARGVSMGTDKALRASYTPSPYRPSTGELTPRLSATPSRTPKSTSRAKDPQTPKIDVTDNLLNIPAKKKAKASDFF